MITDFFITIGTGLGTWVMGLFGDYELPDWVTEFARIFAGLMDSAYGLGVWVPWAVLWVVVSTNLALWSVILAVKVVRWILGLIPTMGGS